MHGIQDTRTGCMRFVRAFTCLTHPSSLPLQSFHCAYTHSFFARRSRVKKKVLRTSRVVAAAAAVVGVWLGLGTGLAEAVADGERKQRMRQRLHIFEICR